MYIPGYTNNNRRNRQVSWRSGGFWAVPLRGVGPHRGRCASHPTRCAAEAARARGSVVPAVRRGEVSMSARPTDAPVAACQRRPHSSAQRGFAAELHACHRRAFFQRLARVCRQAMHLRAPSWHSSYSMVRLCLHWCHRAARYSCSLAQSHHPSCPSGSSRIDRRESTFTLRSYARQATQPMRSCTWARAQHVVLYGSVLGTCVPTIIHISIVRARVRRLVSRAH